jgi:hypothetical protein
MNIGDGKTLLREIVRYNMEQHAKVDSTKKSLMHSTYIVPFFVGDPGVGKTAIPNQVAKEFQEQLEPQGIDFYFSETIVAQYDAGEMAGLPFMGTVEYDIPNGRGEMERRSFQRMIRMRPTYAPDINDPKQQIGIWNLDEMPQAFLANLNICSQITNCWRIGEHLIPEGITITATGNKPENKAGTTPIPTHLRDRLMFILIEPDINEWLKYAAAVQIDPRIRAFLKQTPQHFHKFEVGANASPNPRSWEKTSAVLTLDVPDYIRKAATDGYIGEGTNTVFTAWLKVENKMPKWEDVIASPKTAPIFKTGPEADILYLLLMTLADRATEKNIAAIIEYITRLPNREMSIMWARELNARDATFAKNKHFTAWQMTHAKDLVF